MAKSLFIGTRVFFSSFGSRVLLLLFLLISNNAHAICYDLYPIALPAQGLAGKTNGAVIDVFAGTQPGSFGWMTWGGGLSETTLVRSLTAPGDVATYVNPDRPDDHEIDIGKWVQAKPGISNSKNVRDALSGLINKEIALPVWDQQRGTGANAAYHIVGFAKVRLTDFHLPQANRITAIYLGPAICRSANHAPVVDAGPSQTLTLPNVATLDGTVIEDGLPAGGFLTSEWRVVSGVGSVTFSYVNLTNILSGIPLTNHVFATASFSAEGTYVLQLIASDSELTSSNTVVIVVNRANQPPLAIAQNVALDENTSTNLVLTGSDPDGDSISFSVVNLPDYGVLSGTPPNLTYTPTADFSGSDSFTFRVNDGQLDSALATVNIEVRHVNVAPIADSLSITNDKNITFGISLSGYDSEGSTLTYRLLTSPTNGTLTGTAPELTYQPQTNFYGGDQFTYVVNDGITDSSPATVSLTIRPVDAPPTVVAGSNQFIVLPTNSVQLVGSVTYEDFPDTVESVVWTLVNGPGTVTFSDATNESTTATFSQSGIYQLRLTASDSFLTASNDLFITVDAPPFVSAGLAQTNSYPGIAYLNGSVSDDGLPTNGTVTVVWEKVSGPGTVIFSDQTATNPSVSFSQSGVYTLRLTANDGAVSASDEVTIVMNQAPIVDAGSSRSITNLTMTLEGSVFDDGLPSGSVALLWTFVSGPVNVSFENSSSTNTAVTFSETGVYRLQLAATDSLLTASNQVVITVDAAPVVQAGGDSLITLPATAMLNATATDDGLPEATPLSFHWTQVSGPGEVTFIDPTALTTPAAFSASGVYVVRFTASDSLLSATSDWTVTVNHAPFVDAGAAQLITLPQAANLQGTVSDDGLPSNTVSVNWSQVSGPGVASFQNRFSASTTATFSSSGVYVLRLEATDGISTNSATVEITANAAPTVDAGNKQVVSIANSAPLHGTVTDDGLPAGSSVTVQWVQTSGPGITRFGDSHSAITSASFTTAGVYTLQLIATDGAGIGSATTTVTVTPLGANQPPVVSAGSDRVVSGTNTVLLNGAVTDDDYYGTGYLLSWWSLQSGPGTVTFADTNAPQTAATFSTAGVYVLKLSATDGDYTNSSQVKITIYPDNQPPVVNPGPNQNVIGGMVTLAGHVTDDGLPQGSALSVSWTKVSGPGSVLFAAPSFATSSVLFDQSGTYVLKLTASDTQFTVSSNVTITVSVNKAPVVFAGTDRQIVNTNKIVLEGFASDDGLPAGSSLSKQWSVVTGPSTVSFSNASATNATATFGDQGLYQLRLTATDGQLTNWDDVTISVTSSNVIAYQSTNFLYRFVTTQTAVSNFYTTNFDEVTFTNGQAGFGNYGSCSLNNPTFIHTYWPGGPSLPYLLVRKHFFIPPGSTNLDMGFTVDNNAQVFINEVPISPANIGAGSRYTYNSSSGYFTHANCPTYDDLILARISTNVWKPGYNLLAVRIFDDGGQAFFDARISPNAPTSVLLNQPPFPKVTTNQFVLFPNFLTLSASVQDDGLPANTTKIATWSLVSGPGVASFSTPTSSFAISNDVSTVVTFSAPGNYVLRLTANDGDFNISTDVSVIASTTANGAPVVSAGSDQSVALNGSVTLNGAASDDGLPFGILKTFWSKQSGPGTAWISTLDGVTHAQFSAVGDYVLRFNATDGAVTNSADLTIHVLPAISRSLRVTTLYPPQVEISTGANITGQIFDDGLPAGSVVTNQWVTVSGPGAVVFSQQTLLLPDTSVHADFPQAGSYMVRLVAGDGQLTASADMAITVTDIYQGNHAPVVDAGTAATVAASTPLTLRGFVTDDGLPVGGTLVPHWRQVSGPGTAVFANAAVTNTTATFPTQGLYLLELSATDGQLSGTNTVSILVSNLPAQTLLVNAGADFVVTRPNAGALEGIVVENALPAGRTLTYQWSKVSGPGSVTFQAAGQITTSQTASLPVSSGEAAALVKFGAAGDYVLRLTATDGVSTKFDDVSVTAIDGINTAPIVDAGPSQVIQLQNSAALHPIVTDDGLPNGQLTYSWSKVSGPGTATVSQVNGAYYASFSAAGVYALQLTVSDGQFSASDDLTVNVYASLPAPTVEITSPEDSATITAPTAIIGTVTSPILQSYQVQYRVKAAEGAPANPWTVLTNGIGAVVNGTLGILDPTLLLNGIYEIRATGTDSQGRTSVTFPMPVVIDRALKIGAFSLSFSDLKVPVSGVPIEIIRTYNSRNNRSNDFGIGWSLDIKNVRLQKSRNLGVNWSSEFVTPFYSLGSIQPRRVTITLADDKVLQFESIVRPEDQFAFPIESVRMTFTNLPGTYGTLEIDGDNRADVDGYVGFIDLINFEDFSIFNPTRFRLTTAEGDVYIVDEKQGLQRLSDRNSNTLLITTDGVQWTNTVTHSGGLGVAFVRDNFGRITNIVDPNGGVLRYSYGTNGSLSAFSDRTTNTTTFAYTNVAFPTYLTTVTDPRGVKALRTEYDDSGRMVRQIDADGNAITYGHDLSNNREIVTDRLGHLTVHEYDDNGNVLRRTDALGNVTTSTYDGVDNLITQVDALGNTNRFTYDGNGNKLSETDPLGFTTRHTYGPFRTLTSTKNARGFTTTNRYDSESNALLETQDALGNLMRHTYNGRGDLLTRIDPLGSVISNSYDGLGHLTNTVVIDPQRGALSAASFVFDANGNQLSKTIKRTTPQGVQLLTTLYVYDAEGRVVKTVNPDGSTNQTIYAKGLDKPAVEIDPLGRQTLFSYDSRGNLTNTVFADGTSEAISYDAENRQVAATDRAGRTTFYTNDPLGRLTVVVYPGGAVSNTVYDAIGRVVATVDERGNTNRFDYDPNCGCSGRKAEVIDPLGHVTHYSYDENGNRSSMTDALNHTTTYVYDALDRHTQTIFADGTQTFTAYDAVGHHLAETDQASKTTWFAYDASGRLVTVTNALNQVTSYSYDEAGNLISQTDANNHTTTFEYDSMGRRTKRTMPLGQVESYTYDLAGNLTSKVDFNGRTTSFGYDSLNRLLSKTPDAAFNAASVTFTYTLTGQRATMNDASGAASYFYNERDWLTNKAVQWNLPGGGTHTATLSYAYDAFGNVTNIHSSDANGINLGYSYDSLNRLATVADPQVGVTTYGYDAVGNLGSYTYPNGVGSVHAFDALNRLTNLSTVKAAVTIANYGYTVGLTGRRVTANEGVLVGNQARTINRTYTYDSLYRLTGEQINGAELTSTLGYTHDAVGNRLARASNLGSVSSTISTYDANDRQNGDSYDSNGNTVSATLRDTTSGNPQTVADQYDFEDRLINRNSGQLVIRYDGDGNRVAKTIGSVTTLYLVDDRNPSGFAQVLEELVTAGSTPAVARVYAYGNSLISQDQLQDDGHGPLTWATSFYGHDGHGNIRYLTDSAGIVTDTYDYDAFGVLIAHSGNTPNTYLYCGEQFDGDLNLYYNRARYLNHDTGRFWTRDSYEGDTQDPRSLHKYSYTYGDPANNWDPSGYMTLGELMQEIKIEFDARKNQFKAAKKAYDLSKKAVCNAGRLTFTAGAVYYGGHHIFPKFLGGPAAQKLAQLDPELHRVLHRILNTLVKDDPLLNELSALGGPNGSTSAWSEALKDPAKAKRILQLLKKATKAIDKYCGFKEPATLSNELNLLLK